MKAILFFGLTLITASCQTMQRSSKVAGSNDVARASHASIVLPTKLICTTDGDESAEKHVIYTRLASITSRDQFPATVWDSHNENGEQPRRDEVAYGWKDEYFSASISKDEFKYDLWTCDTEDRAYSFKTADLIAPAPADAPNTRTRSIKGKLNISERDLSDDYDLTCQVIY